MFQSPLKTVTEKLKPTQSKSSISSLKFERPSDFKKFIGFIKNETQELEKIKLPTRAEIKPKSKSGGVGGLLALGLFGGLGAAFGGGEGEDEGNLRVGSAGGTASQFNKGVLLTKNIKRTKEISKVRTEKTFDKRIDQRKRKARAKRLVDLRKRKAKLKNIKDATVKRKKTISKKLTKPYRFEISRQSDLLDELLGRQTGVKGLDIDPNRTSDLFDVDRFLKTGKLPTDSVSAEQLDLLKAIDKLDLSETDKIVKDIEGGKGIFDKYTDKDFFDAAERVKKAQDDIEKTFYDIETLRTSQKVPNLRIQSSGAMSLFGDKGFSIKDTLDKGFKFMGQKSKPLRNFLTPAAKNIAKSPISKSVGKLFPLVDAAGAVIAFNDLGLVDFSDGILKPKVGRDNIVTSVYDMFTAFYNAGVDIVGADESNKRLFITKSRDKKIRAYDDAYNKKILEARRLKKIYNFDTAMVNNPNIQLPKSNIFAYQKPDGAEFTIPFDYSNSGIYDYNAPIFQKLYKQ